MDRDQDFVLEVSVSDFRRSRIASVSSEEPASGTVRFAIEHLALSANNLTYAALGDALGYWRLYPADEGWGRIPAWGCARVVESNQPDFVSGERYFGLLPMASAVTMRPSRTRADFREESPHRASLNPVYNRYARVGGQSEAELEDNSLFRPLFIASFTVDAYLTEADFFGAEALVIVSASAKAALGLGVLARGKRPVIALTSGSNAGFVASTGVYRDVIPYDGLEALGDVPSAVVVDFSGNAGLQQRIAQTLGSRLLRFIGVGATHGTLNPVDEPLSGMAPSEFFFAPTQVQKLVADWGPAGFERRLAAALGEFVEVSRPWFVKRHADGPSALLDAYERLVDRRIGPDELVIARPNGKAEI